MNKLLTSFTISDAPCSPSPVGSRWNPPFLELMDGSKTHPKLFFQTGTPSRTHTSAQEKNLSNFSSTSFSFWDHRHICYPPLPTSRSQSSPSLDQSVRSRKQFVSSLPDPPPAHRGVSQHTPLWARLLQALQTHCEDRFFFFFLPLASVIHLTWLPVTWYPHRAY